MKFLFHKGNISITVGSAAPGERARQQDPWQPYYSQVSTWSGSVLVPLPNPRFYHMKRAVW